MATITTLNPTDNGATSRTTINGNFTNLNTQLNSPQGFLQNGKIVTSVSNNNLVIEIKTLAGTDPSSTDPVYVRIGNTIRSITEAVMLTRAAGVNSWDAGSVELATFEVDYFVYLGWSTVSNKVDMAVSRVPNVVLFSEFSASVTNPKYSLNTAGFNSTDEVEVVGRFNAVNSGTASFNWSIPATSIIVNRPIFNTRWLTFDSQLTWTGTAPTSENSAFKLNVYRIEMEQVNISITRVFGSAGSGITGAQASSPIDVNSFGLGSGNFSTMGSLIFSANNDSQGVATIDSVSNLIKMFCPSRAATQLRVYGFYSLI